MSRTAHLDLTPSRRSKRLLQNGYYLQPPGDPLPPQEMSSEEEDDNASIHSNNSSVYSERQVHYAESTTPIFTHKRRRRKGLESPRIGNLLVQKKSQSPRIKKKFRREATHAESTSRSTPYLAVSKRDDVATTSTTTTSNHIHAATRETKTMIHSVQRTQRYASSGESDAVVQSSRATQQESISDTAVNNDILNELIRNSIMSRNQSEYNAIGSGDQMSTASYMRRREGMTSTPINNARNVSERGDASSNKINESHISQYSSIESDAEDDGIQRKKYVSPVAIALAKVVSILVLATTWISTCVGHICRTIYMTSLSIACFDVWLLSRRTSPLLANVIRAILILLLLLLLYLIATRVLGEETLLVPVQSVAGLFQILSQKISAVYVLTGNNEGTIYQPQAVIDKAPTTQSESYPRSYPELEETLSKMEIHFADKLVQVKDEVKIIRQEQIDFNKKQMDKFEAALSTLEGKLQREINEQLSQSNTQMAEKLVFIKNEVSTLRMNHSSTGASMKAEIDQLRGLLSDKSQMSAKLSEFNTRLAAFDSRLNMLNNLLVKSVKDFDQHIGNTTYIKEIAKMQFIESFLKLIKTGEGSADDRNSLHFLFIAWLKKQGFAQVVEVERDMKTISSNNNFTMAMLEKKFSLHLERIRQNTKRHSSTITLEKIVERPMQSTDEAGKIGSEAQVREWIQNELAIYSADRIAQADHALETAGGFIVSTRCSESYQRKTALVSLFGIPIYYNVNTPRSVIQASTLPGECWSFKGSEGYIVISLSGAVQPTSFTLEHIPRELSPYGKIDSAPKDFHVLGLKDSYDYTGVVLGKYRYEENGPVIQQFTVTSENADYFTHVELRVTSNWGHPEYTCIYRFRVHGSRQGAEAALPY
ncbi:uncharacterized protein LOC120328062 [Styela clava]